MDSSELKSRVCAEIGRRSEWIISVAEHIKKTPEAGYKETKTAAYVASEMKKLGLTPAEGLGVTGVKARAQGAHSLKTVAVMGELDAVICPSHPQADPVTGAAHACGHNAQIAAMLGAAAGLISSGVIKALDGDAVFLAVPAEEMVEFEYRRHLQDEGKIKYLGGKQELIAKGIFDDIDMAIMVHAQANQPLPKVYVHGGSLGMLGKAVRFIGREAHAGGAPHEGVNALNAAMAAIVCINAQRETFRDEDKIRVHPIITKGGDQVNIVPADVRMEANVRGKTIAAMTDANKKVNRAIYGAAYAIGAKAEICDIPGYMPMKQDRILGELFKNNAEQIVGADNIIEGVDMIGSTDVGDLCCIMPAIQPTMGGFDGSAHSRDFHAVDPEAAYIMPAKIMAMTVIDLLCGGCAGAQTVLKAFQPITDREGYTKMWKDIVEKDDGNKIELD